MSKATRMLAMAGMALVAGATFSACPAAASTSTAQGTTAAKQNTQQTTQANHGRDREWVAGYFRTRRTCERVGWFGERRDRWDDYDCERVRRGHRVFWRLEVERDRRGHWDNNNNNRDWNNNDRDRGNWDRDNRDRRHRGHRH